MSIKEAAAPFLERYWHSLPGNFRGAIWALVAAFTFIVVQSMTKHLGGKFDSVQIAFFRAAFGGLAVAPFLMSRGLGGLRTENMGYHVGRGVFGAMALFLMVVSILHMPLAEVTVIGFTRAFFLIVLAVLFLKEKVRWRRWSATVVGFGGVTLMLRPGDEAFQLAALAALAASFCFAAAHVCIKKCTTKNDHPLTVQSWYWLIATSLTLFPALWYWVTPTWEELLFLVLLGVLSGIAQAFWAYALSAGEATFISPFDFSRLIWAGLAGVIIFGEEILLVTILGAAVIIGSNLYIARRQALENRRAKAATKPDA
jgi:drug/metabolite transporter (DMT)-like permease